MSRIQTYYRSGLLIVVLFIASSCTERIDIELGSTFQRLVVHGTVTTDSVRHQVILSVSSDYFANKPSPRISKAVVELSFDDMTLLLSEHDTIPGLYETPYAFRGVEGTTYKLDISQVDADQDGQYETYHATSTMPGGTVLYSIELRYIATPIFPGYQVAMYAIHLPEQRDWFGFKLWKNGFLLTDTLAKYSVMSDDLFDDGYFPGFPAGFLSDEDPRQAVHPGDTVTLELNCIEQEYYNFVIDAQLEIMGNNPLFSGPSANVSTNIDNGALGIFAAYSIQRASSILPQ